MDNLSIAKQFSEIADMLEILDENRFRVAAYRRAVETIESLPHNVATMPKDALLEIPGIGEGIAHAILEIAQHGTCTEFAVLKKKVPQRLLEILAIEGMGPKTTALVWKKFGVESLLHLERLLTTGKLEKVPGFGVKKVENIKRGIAQRKQSGGRQPLGRVLPIAEEIAESLRSSGLCDKVEIAGSLRRMKELIGDIDILATSKKPKAVMEGFTTLPNVERTIAQGETKATVMLTSGLECDLRVVAPEEFGAALYYFTGSKEHNVRTRTMAVKQGLTVNEYGVFRGSSKRQAVSSKDRIAGKTEEEVLKAIGLPWIPPEIREDRGEIAAALAGKLPHLITEKDIQGNLHTHSEWSDGMATIEDVVREAKRRGYEYIAMTDHASSIGIVRGTKEKTVDAYIARVRAAGKKVGGIHVLAGVEVDIEEDGSTFLSDRSLQKFDFVIGAVHSYFKQDRTTATKRFLRAITNPNIDCIGHLTTRHVGGREPMDLDIDAILKAAARVKTIIELNAHWVRLDINDVQCRLAKEYGVPIAISTDAHTLAEFDVIRYGIATARRGWLEKKDVVNMKTWKELREFFRNSKS
ncbi:DNA polymerase/3'-5' exonuclease PolX [Candidatus Uhrbacteria bacterium]|nr:DNA polymerase/3'-5' exonuclease PolX [Candidatus Uhrbacteria bacterium]